MDAETHDDLAATLAARQELGAAHEDELIDAFLERLDQRVATRAQGASLDLKATAHMRFVIAIVSLGTGIPISAIAAALGGLPGLLVAWVGVVGVNLAFRR